MGFPYVENLEFDIARRGRHNRLVKNDIFFGMCRYLLFSCLSGSIAFGS
jgi:hypothetical protein